MPHPGLSLSSLPPPAPPHHLASPGPENKHSPQHGPTGATSTLWMPELRGTQATGTVVLLPPRHSLNPGGFLG